VWIYEMSVTEARSDYQREEKIQIKLHAEKRSAKATRNKKKTR
jgi:hypothetical protein